MTAMQCTWCVAISRATSARVAEGEHEMMPGCIASATVACSSAGMRKLPDCGGVMTVDMVELLVLDDVLRAGDEVDARRALEREAPGVSRGQVDEEARATPPLVLVRVDVERDAGELTQLRRRQVPAAARRGRRTSARSRRSSRLTGAGRAARGRPRGAGAPRGPPGWPSPRRRGLPSDQKNPSGLGSYDTSRHFVCE